MRKAMAQVRTGWILGLLVLAGSMPAAQAAITIEVAEVQNGVAFIKGNGAVLGNPISWEGRPVATASRKKGSFRFSASCRRTAGGRSVTDCKP